MGRLGRAARRGRSPHRRHEGPEGDHRRRLELRHQCLGLPPGEPVEPGQEVLPVLPGEDLLDLADGAQAEASLPDGLDDLREVEDELGGGLAVLGRTGRQAQLPAEEVEEGGVAQLPPPLVPVEGGERQEEPGQGEALGAEHLLEVAGEIACGCHSATVSRGFEASVNAQRRALARAAGARVAGPFFTARRGRAARSARLGGGPGAFARRQRDSSRNASSAECGPSAGNWVHRP